MAGNSMERIFTNSLGGTSGSSRRSRIDGVPYYPDDQDQYDADIAAMIDDANDYEESGLMPEREDNLRYFEGLEPNLGYTTSEEYSSYDDAPEEGDSPSRSTAVSSDVKDTVMAIIPELMRIFAASEHSVDFVPSNQGSADMAKQATDYIRYKFWDDNDGFTVLHDAIMDCLVTKIGIIQWWLEDYSEVCTDTYRNVSEGAILTMLDENQTAEVVHFEQPDADGMFPSVSIRYEKSKPQLRIEAVPPEEFRISRRRAKNVYDKDLVGRQRWVRAGWLIEKGYDPDVVYMFTGDSEHYSTDQDIRDPYEQIGHDVLGDLVMYGEYYIRIDRDGDGINELRHVCTLGSNHFIVKDDYASDVQYAVFSPNRRQHTVIGTAISDITKDIQRINTNLLRGALDSLAQSINPRTAINETLTNVDDAMNDDLGAIIRTKGDPQTAVYPIVIPFVGRDAFDAKSQMDIVRQRRTGISEASSGIDPKALQSTAVMGIDLIANGAQARIELIARIIAEVGLAPMYRGLLKCVVNSPNKSEIIQVRGEWVDVNPSTFDPSMRVKVNPALGKGSDMTRLMALRDIRDTQMTVIGKFGLNNGIVGVEHVRNTIVDMMAIANIRNVTRYFGEITPEIKAAIANAPREPDPAEVLAQAELEKVKKDTVIAQAELDQSEIESKRKDDLERDKLAAKTYTDVLGIMAEFAKISSSDDEAIEKGESYNTPSY